MFIQKSKRYKLRYIYGSLAAGGTLSMMLLTMPIIYPILDGLGFDLIWFGIFLVLLSETDFLTPPVGLKVYVIQRIAKSPLAVVIRGVVPHVFLLFRKLIIIAIFPKLALWLPGLMAY